MQSHLSPSPQRQYLSLLSFCIFSSAAAVAAMLNGEQSYEEQPVDVLGRAECQNSTSALQSKEKSALARNLLQVVSRGLKLRFRQNFVSFIQLQYFHQFWRKTINCMCTTLQVFFENCSLLNVGKADNISHGIQATYKTLKTVMNYIVLNSSLKTERHICPCSLTISNL